jgi:hypothetical protein
MPVFQAERVPRRGVRVATGLVLWPLGVALLWLVGQTFQVWGGDGGPLDVRTVGLPLVLLASVALVFGIQFAGVRIQQTMHVGFPRRRAILFWASWTVLGILLGSVQAFATLAPDETVLRTAMLLVAYALSIPFGLAIWVRFSN